MNRLPAFVSVLAVAFLASGCGSGGALADDADPNLITRAEIEAAPTATNARILVERLRPRWLYVRGTKAVRPVGNIRTANDASAGIDSEAVSVYVNQSRLGTSEQLASISRVNVESLRYLTPSQALVQFGATNSLGAIVVTIRD